MDKISIIVPIYNVEKYLKTCIESIINQSYENLEILLIDDGSTDGSSRICDDFAKIDNRIKVIHKKNEGVSVARNLGMELCTGQYVCFVDSDDFLEKDYCEILYKNLKETDSDISMVAYRVLDYDGSILTDASLNNEIGQDEIIVYRGLDVIKEVLKQKTIRNFSWDKLYKKSVLCNFPIGVNYEDMPFMIQVMSGVSKVVYVNRCCYNYVKRESSITATVSEKNLNDFAKVMYDRYILMEQRYPEFKTYNFYAFLESVLALSTKNAISDRKYKSVDDNVIKFVDIIKDYVSNNNKECELLPLLNDYQKASIYLMKYNLDLYFSFLKERQKLRDKGLI